VVALGRVQSAAHKQHVRVARRSCKVLLPPLGQGRKGVGRGEAPAAHLREQLDGAEADGGRVRDLVDDEL
jgi:hypothetical protein